MSSINVYLDTKYINNSCMIVTFHVDEDGHKNNLIFFEINGPIDNFKLKNLDAAAVGLVNYGMATGQGIHFHGDVSKRLLENLEEFQCAWTRWMPSYKKIDITANKEILEHSIPENEDAICTFSGGVDATFSLWRHYFKKAGRHHKNIRSAVLIQGFDIDMDDHIGMLASMQRAARTLDGLDVNLYSVRTNLRNMWLPDWEMNFGAGCATILHLFSNFHSFGIIGGDEPYDQLVIPWGSNPITNHLLSSQRFKLIYDGNGYSRTEKVSHIAEWPAGRDNLRVCWQGQKMGYNCGQCEKCKRTKLNFLAAGHAIPMCFDEGININEIEKIIISNEAVRTFYAEIVATAEAKGVTDPWVGAVKGLL